MNPSTTNTPSRLSLPLSNYELAEATDVAERLRGELYSVLLQASLADHTAMALASKLGINRNITQRTFAGLDREYSAVLSLGRFPGPEGLRTLAGAIHKHAKLAKGVYATLLAAIDSYERFINTTAGSQLKLIRRIEIGERGHLQDQGGDNLPLRKKLFEHNAELFSTSLETMVSLSMVRPLPDDPDRIEGADLLGAIGMQSSKPRRVAGSSLFGGEGRAYRPIFPPHPSGVNLAEEFCSKPLPKTLVEYQEGVTKTMLELDCVPPASCTYVIGHRWASDLHPALQSDPFWWNSIGVYQPIKRLLMDVYIHKSMASRSVASLIPLVWDPSKSGNPIQHWNSRIPGRYALEMLGSEGDKVATTSWPRHKDLVARTFDALGWPARDFVGFRCDIAYPLWSSSVYIVFDFRSGKEPRDQ